MSRKISILICILYLSGCAISPYTPPKVGNIAYLKSNTSSSDYRFLGGFSTNTIGVGELDDSGCVGLRKSHPIKKESLNEAGMAEVKAGVPLSFYAGYSVGNKSCGIFSSATLRKDKQYRFSFIRGDKKCGIRLDEEVGDGTTKPVKMTRMYDYFTKFCIRD